MNRPQYAKDFEERYIRAWPVMVQPKKDGGRCMVDVNVAGWAKPRNKKPLVQHKDHIQAKLQKALSPAAMEQIGTLDGELYSDALHFEDICSGIKATNTEYHKKLEYHIFDTMNQDKPFKDRYAHLSWWYGRLCVLNPGFDQFIKLVPCTIAHNMKELTALMDKWSATDEGVIVRDPNEHYVFDHRTRGCMRWKYMKDAEYPVWDIREGVGKNVGIPTFYCFDPKLGGAHDKYAQFKAASMGEESHRRMLWRERDNIIMTKEVTVVFQNLTKRGVPRFGSVKVVRDYEE